MNSPTILQRITDEAQQITAATSRRDDLIRKAAKAGVSARQIADAAGVTHPTISRIAKDPNS